MVQTQDGCGLGQEEEGKGEWGTGWGPMEGYSVSGSVLGTGT